MVSTDTRNSTEYLVSAQHNLWFLQLRTENIGAYWNSKTRISYTTRDKDSLQRGTAIGIQGREWHYVMNLFIKSYRGDTICSEPWRMGRIWGVRRKEECISGREEPTNVQQWDWKMKWRRVEEVSLIWVFLWEKSGNEGTRLGSNLNVRMNPEPVTC